MAYLYKNCGDLPIFNFDMIYKTNDYKYLVVGYDGYSEISIPKGSNERWDEIKSEWIVLLDDNTVAYYYQLILECVYLETRYKMSKVFLYEIFTREMDEETMDTYIEALSQWNYKWNIKNSKIKELQRLLNQHKGSENKMNLKLDELKQMREENGYDDDDSDKSSLEKQAVALELITDKNNIDTKTTSVRKWVEIGKSASRINEQRMKSNGK
jgi:predicted acetyltransferase